jgi:hypothetical protein
VRNRESRRHSVVAAEPRVASSQQFLRQDAFFIAKPAQRGGKACFRARRSAML